MEPEEIFAQLNGSRVFSKIDRSNAFLQIPLTLEAQELTTITTPFVLYRYKFLPFGLAISPGIFQKAINKLLSGLTGVFAYQDDLIIYGNSYEQHDCNLCKVLNSLLMANVQINKEKSLLRQSSISYLGYILDANGIMPDPNRIKPLKNAEPPKSRSELKSLLGFLCQTFLLYFWIVNACHQAIS